MEPSYVIVADLVAALHAGFIAFIVFGLVAIIIGARAGWRWVRTFWFRLLHLVAIGFVSAETVAGKPCLLTTLEDRLRQAAGGAGYSRDFIGYWLDRLIFYDFPAWVFTLAYAAFALVVVALFIVVPPRRG